MTLLTIFTAPKPFTNPHIATIQRNAIRSWVELGEDVDVILLGEEDGLSEAATALGVRHIPQVKRNAQGTPLINDMFRLAREHSASPLLACVNADIILLPDFVDAARQMLTLAKHFLAVGQRYDLAVTELLAYSPGWQERIKTWVAREGRLHPRGGSDYFIFRREAFTDMPAFAIGRAGWDNWMIYAARMRGYAVVDATESIQIIHQDHDYGHLPGGQPHYRLPETFENVRLAGGPRTIFTLIDTNRRLVNGRLLLPRREARKFWRDVEVFPLVTLRSRWLGQLFFAMFHPKKAYGELRRWLAERKNNG